MPGEAENVPGGSEGKESACSARDPDSIPGSGRSPGEGHGNPLQYSCLEDPMDGGACILAWTEEPGRLWPIGSQRVRHNWSDLARKVEKINFHVYY